MYFLRKFHIYFLRTFGANFENLIWICWHFFSFIIHNAQYVQYSIDLTKLDFINIQFNFKLNFSLNFEIEFCLQTI